MHCAASSCNSATPGLGGAPGAGCQQAGLPPAALRRDGGGQEPLPRLLRSPQVLQPASIGRDYKVKQKLGLGRTSSDSACPQVSAFYPRKIAAVWLQRIGQL